MVEEIAACPECDSSDVCSRASDPLWYCRKCGASFALPAYRERQHDGGRRAGGAQALIDADPDDFP